MLEGIKQIEKGFMVAIALAVATFVVSCGSEDEAEVDFSKTPMQVLDNMVFEESDKGVATFRMRAPRMEKYKDEKQEYELFPKGFYIYGYTAEGELETTIFSNKAKHIKASEGLDESWTAMGNVVVINHLKGQKIETDTLYWDRNRHTIWNNCFTKLYDPDGYMEGYSLNSDERAANAIIQRPFNSYVVIEKDSLKEYRDTANFIGPRLKCKSPHSLIVPGKEEVL